MKKWQKLLVFAVAFGVLLTLSFGVTGMVAFGESYIEIDSGEELRKIGLDPAYPLDGDYRLTADIDLSDADWYGIGYDPVADTENQFTGSFDGQGHVIKGMHCGAPGAPARVYECWGLVCWTTSPVTIKNIIFEDVYLNVDENVPGYGCAGVVLGWAGGSATVTIENVAVVSGSLYMDVRQSRIGGILGCNGSNGGVTIKNCFNAADVTGAASGSNYYVAAGGIVGNAESKNLTMTQCVNVGKIASLSGTAGGVSTVVSHIGGTISSGTVPGAFASGTSVSDCYSMAGATSTAAGGYLCTAEADGVTLLPAGEMGNPAKYENLSSGWTLKEGYYPFPAALNSDYAVPAVEGSSVINIKNGAELRKIGLDPAYPLNGDYRLTADIDLSDADWYGIGYDPVADNEYQFTGSFDGQGHVIKGMHCGAPGAPARVFECWGLICWTTSPVTIKNIIFEDVYLNVNENVPGYGCAGVALGWAGGSATVTIENVAVLSGSLYMDVRQSRIGGILGSNGSTGGVTIKNCFNAADITGAASGTNYYVAAGGIVGNADGKNVEISDCVNVGKIASLSGTAGTYSTVVSNIAGRSGNGIVPPGFASGTSVSNSYSLSGLLSVAAGGNIDTSENTGVAIVDRFSADDASKYPGLGSDWTVKEGYYPMLTSFSDKAVAIDRAAEEAALSAYLQSVGATNYITAEAFEDALSGYLTDFSVALSLVNKATETEAGAWTVKVTLSDSTEKTYTVAIPRLPAMQYEFSQRIPGLAEGTVTVVLPEEYGVQNYQLYWGTETGLLSGYSQIIDAADFTVNNKTLTYQFQDRAAIPAGVTHLWFAVDGVAVCSYEIPVARRLVPGNLKYSYGVLSDTHLTRSSLDHSITKAFAAAMELFDSADVSFVSITGDVTTGGMADQYQGITNVFNDGGYTFPLWIALGNHDILAWNLDKIDGADAPYSPEEWAVSPSQALQNAKDAIETYANVGYTGDNNEYKVTLSEYYPDYDYTVAYKGDLYIYMGIGALKNESGTNVDQHLAPNQLVWLKEVLEGYYGKADTYGHVYLMFHYYTLESGLGMYQNGETSGTEWSQNRNGYMTEGYSSSEELFKILKNYPDVVHFSGHTHREFDAKNNLSITQKHVFDYTGTSWTDVNAPLGYTAVHVPSGQYYEGYLVSVYENGVLLTGYNTFTGEALGYATYYLSNELSEDVKVRVNDGKVQYVEGYGEWLDLIKTDTLAPNAEIEVQTNDTHVQWRVKGQNEWKDLIALEDLEDLGGKMMQVGFSFENALTHLKYGDATMLTAVGGQSTGRLTYSVVSGPATVDPVTGLLKVTGLGEIVVKAVLGEDNEYVSAEAYVTIIGERRPITVTADDQTKVYGAADPGLTYKVTTGTVVNNDAIAGSLKYTGTNAGTYDIVEDTAFGHDLYEITFVKGTMTITKKAVTVTADNQTKVYGAADPTLTYKVEGLVGNDTLTGSLKYTGTNVGTYDIVKDAGFENANYDVTFVKGTMTITKKAVTVTADDQTKVYGAADPSLTYKVEGLVGNDTLTGTLKYTGSNVGTYDIVKDTGFENGNYDVTFVKGTMTITPASTDSNQGGSSGTTDSNQGGSSASTDSNQGGSSGTTTDGDASSGNTGNAGNANTGDTGSGNPSTSDRNLLSFVALLLACVASFVGVIWFAKRRKEN